MSAGSGISRPSRPSGFIPSHRSSLALSLSIARGRTSPSAPALRNAPPKHLGAPATNPPRNDLGRAVAKPGSDPNLFIDADTEAFPPSRLQRLVECSVRALPPPGAGAVPTLGDSVR